MMTLISIYLVIETWCTFMSLYKHLVHLKSTIGKQSVLAFVYNIGIYIWTFCCCGDPVSESNHLLCVILTTVTEVMCSLQGSLLPRKGVTLGANKPGIKETRETQLTLDKIHAGDFWRSMSMCSGGTSSVVPRMNTQF